MGVSFRRRIAMRTGCENSFGHSYCNWWGRFCICGIVRFCFANLCSRVVPVVEKLPSSVVLSCVDTRRTRLCFGKEFSSR